MAKQNTSAMFSQDSLALRLKPPGTAKSHIVCSWNFNHCPYLKCGTLNMTELLDHVHFIRIIHRTTFYGITVHMQEKKDVQLEPWLICLLQQLVRERKGVLWQEIPQKHHLEVSWVLWQLKSQAVLSINEAFLFGGGTAKIKTSELCTHRQSYSLIWITATHRAGLYITQATWKLMAIVSSCYMLGVYPLEIPTSFLELRQVDYL